MNKQIGWFHLKNDEIFTKILDNDIYECIYVESGRYPMIVKDYKYIDIIDDENTTCVLTGKDMMVYIEMDGELVTDVLNDAQYIREIPIEDVVNSIINNPNTEFELSEEYKALKYKLKINQQEMFIISKK